MIARQKAARSFAMGRTLSVEETTARAESSKYKKPLSALLDNIQLTAPNYKDERSEVHLTDGQ